MVTHEEGRFTGSDGLQLFWRCWRPSDETAQRSGAPRAVVVLVHGVGEHSGRYPNLVLPLVADGFTVCAYDHRGHGCSPGPRGHVDRWRLYRDDLAAFLAVSAAREPTAPLVLFGHSMGSLVVLDYLESPAAAAQPPLAGAVVSGVALQPAGVGKPHQVVMARLLSRVAPRLVVDLGIRPDELTSDPAGFLAAVGDPLLSSKATVRWGAESMAALRRVKAGLSRVELPLLVLHGGDDPLNRPAGARELCDAVGSADTTLHIYPGVRHEPHNDTTHAQVAADVSTWLARVTSGADAG